jgi:hypothetical protein
MEICLNCKKKMLLLENLQKNARNSFVYFVMTISKLMFKLLFFFINFHINIFV